jgi:hypothetical protein
MSYTTRRTIRYEVPITEPVSQGRGYVTVGRIDMEAEVEVDIDIEAVARTMGRRACTNKSKRSVDGYVTVKRVGLPREVGRRKL